ncbi:GntR family transcriptional regulator [Salinisphaera sp.]|uniref:GntR family transcriptional regulator n=1 Tax=Salinisphaera sp. TaxID=1914330 RepID=UPI002D771F84|nr:GntR family transcriptional regulator [Salinisphaera sp.]HET7313605.1 GntR family transcriptional regulator [Salinisphaera sp.]
MTTATARTGESGRTEDLEAQIYSSIRHAVLTQQLTSDTRLPELTLSKIYDVNRTVVRRALGRLASDHIVVLRRNQSAVIASPGPDETMQLFAARRHIEAEAMRQTAGNIDNKTREAIEKVVAEEHHAHAEGVHDDRIHLSLRFHERLADACPNRVLGQILQDLILRTSIAVALYKVPGMAACYRATDHRSIAEALFDGDGERAARAACEHLNYLEDRLNYATRIRRVDLATILTG